MLRTESKRASNILFIILFFVVVEYLPIVNAIEPRIVSVAKMGMMVFFYFEVFVRNERLATFFIITSLIVLIVSIYAYYNCWISFLTPVSFVLKRQVCWFYIQVGLFFCKYGKGVERQIIRRWSTIIICLTMITSIVSVRLTPTAMRELGNGSKNIAGLETELYLRNTLNWGGVYGLVFLLSCFLYRTKYINDKKDKWISICTSILICLCVIQSQITAAIVIVALLLILLLFPRINVRQKSFVLIIAATLIAMIAGMAEPVSRWASSFLKEMNLSTLSLRTHQIHVLLSEGRMIGTIDGRLGFYRSSFTAFLEHPLLGNCLRGVEKFSIIGLHSQILDMLAATGLIGFIPLALMFSVFMRLFIKEMKDKEQLQVFKAELLLLLLLMLINPTYYSSAVFLSVYVGPGVFMKECA